MDKSWRAEAHLGKEWRSFGAEFEVRGKAGSVVQLRGYATVYDQPYEMYDMFGPYNEVMRGGSGKKTLSENPQVQWLLNHGGLSMAYTKPDTLRLAEDSTGLEAIADVDQRRSDVQDMLYAIERGDVDEMSFAFRVPAGKSIWSPDYDQRDITEYDLSRGDVSVVNFGANPHTQVGRGQDPDLMDESTARRLLERLQRRFEITTAAPLVDDQTVFDAELELLLIG